MSRFIDYLLRNKIDNKLYTLAFFIAVISYSAWQPLEKLINISKENKGSIFYIGIAFSFCCYTSAYMFTKWEKWRWFPMFVFLICLSRLSKEVFYLFQDKPKVDEYDLFDYINFLITIFIVFNYYVKWQYENYKSIK